MMSIFCCHLDAIGAGASASSTECVVAYPDQETILCLCVTCRWYPTVLTMPNGLVLIVGGSRTDGYSGYGSGPADQANTPTYQYYDPTTG